MYRLLAIDLDGTLLSPQKVVTHRTYDALTQAVDYGMKLVIATGQTLNVLRAVCGDLPLNAPQIIYNGAIIADISPGTILHEQLVPQEQILPTLALLRDAGLYRAYHTHQHVYVDQDTPNARGWYRPPVPPAIEVADVTSIYPQPCIKLVGVGDESTLRAQRQELERLLADQLYVTQASRDLLKFFIQRSLKEMRSNLLHRAWVSHRKRSLPLAITIMILVCCSSPAWASQWAMLTTK